MLALAVLFIATSRSTTGQDQGGADSRVGGESASNDSGQPDAGQTDDSSPDREAGPSSDTADKVGTDGSKPVKGDKVTADDPEEKPLSAAEQARRHYQEGTDAMRAGSYREAAAHLKAAVKLAPDRSDYFFKLGEISIKQRDANGAWQYLRKAQKLDPEDDKTAAAFLQVWNLFERLGALDLGTSPRRVRSHLGTPDNDVTRGSQKRLHYGFMVASFVNNRLASIIDTRDLSTDEVKAVDRLVLEFDRKKWKTADRRLSRRAAMVTHVPIRENMREWTERVTQHRLIGLRRRGISAGAIARRIRSETSDAQGGVTWNFVEEKPDDVVFETIIPASDAQPGLHEITRIVHGRNDIHRVSYTKKGSQLTFEQRALWLDAIRTAEVVGVGSGM